MREIVIVIRSLSPEKSRADDLFTTRPCYRVSGNLAVLNVQGRGVIAIIGHGNLAVLKVLKWMIIQQNARLTLSHGLRAAAVDV